VRVRLFSKLGGNGPNQPLRSHPHDMKGNYPKEGNEAVHLIGAYKVSGFSEPLIENTLGRPRLQSKECGASLSRCTTIRIVMKGGRWRRSNDFNALKRKTKSVQAVVGRDCIQNYVRRPGLTPSPVHRSLNSRQRCRKGKNKGN